MRLCANRTEDKEWKTRSWSPVAAKTKHVRFEYFDSKNLKYILGCNCYNSVPLL